VIDSLPLIGGYFCKKISPFGVDTRMCDKIGKFTENKQIFKSEHHILLFYAHLQFSNKLRHGSCTECQPGQSPGVSSKGGGPETRRRAKKQKRGPHF